MLYLIIYTHTKYELKSMQIIESVFERTESENQYSFYVGNGWNGAKEAAAWK